MDKKKSNMTDKESKKVTPTFASKRKQSTKNKETKKKRKSGIQANAAGQVTHTVIPDSKQKRQEITACDSAKGSSDEGQDIDIDSQEVCYNTEADLSNVCKEDNDNDKSGNDMIVMGEDKDMDQKVETDLKGETIICEKENTALTEPTPAVESRDIDSKLTSGKLAELVQKRNEVELNGGEQRKAEISDEGQENGQGIRPTKTDSSKTENNQVGSNADQEKSKSEEREDSNNSNIKDDRGQTDQIDVDETGKRISNEEESAEFEMTNINNTLAMSGENGVDVLPCNQLGSDLGEVQLKSEENKKDSESISERKSADQFSEMESFDGRNNSKSEVEITESKGIETIGGYSRWSRSSQELKDTTNDLQTHSSMLEEASQDGHKGIIVNQRRVDDCSDNTDYIKGDTCTILDLNIKLEEKSQKSLASTQSAEEEVHTSQNFTVGTQCFSAGQSSEDYNHAVEEENAHQDVTETCASETAETQEMPDEREDDEEDASQIFKQATQVFCTTPTSPNCQTSIHTVEKDDNKLNLDTSEHAEINALETMGKGTCLGNETISSVLNGTPTVGGFGDIGMEVEIHTETGKTNKPGCLGDSEIDEEQRDITDSQLCALDWGNDASLQDTKSNEECRTQQQHSDGTTIVKGLIKELSTVNMILLKSKREYENEKRRQNQILRQSKANQGANQS